MNETGIEWTDVTWNPATGCNKVSPGCKNCYADALAQRLRSMGNARYRNGFSLTLHADKIREPMKWKKPSRVFVNSMSDLLHKDIPLDFILSCFRTMAVLAPQHTYQVLTKRGERWDEVSRAVMAEFGKWPRNVWPGVTVESRAYLHRLDQLGLAGDGHTIRMVSAEPLLNSLCQPAHTHKWADPNPVGVEALAGRLRASRIGWVISGGEAGWSARPAQMEWFREIRDACALAGVAYFHKQHGGVGVTKKAKSGGEDALIDGVMHHGWPATT